MKLYVFFLMGLCLAVFYSCSKETEDNVSELETNMKINIPLFTEGTENKSVSSTHVIEYTFSGENTYQLSNLSEKENEAAVVKSIQPKPGSMLSIPVQNDFEFNNLQLEWNYISIPDNNDVQKSIDLLSYNFSIEDGVFKVNLDEALAQIINENNEPVNYNSIDIKIFGKSNYSISTTAQINIPVVVETIEFPPRFELF